MIHYHGAEIYPDTDAIKIMDGRHVFISAAYPRQVEIAAEVSQSFAFDNGSFTPWRKGEKYNHDGYYKFVDKWFTHPGFDFGLIPDVIDGNLQDNKNFIKDWPFCKSIGVPVYHLHEPLSWLQDLAEEFPRIAIGSSGEYATIGTDMWWHRMADIFHRICVDGRPITKVHGLRMLNPDIFTRFPFSSADSTNVARHHNDSSRIYPNTTHKLNGSILIHKIEKQQSASRLKGIPKQQGFFNLK